MIKLRYSHSFSREEAQARVQTLTDYWARKYAVQVSWNGSTASVAGKVKGVKFDGLIYVEEREVRADINAGFLAEKLGGRGYVDGKLTDYLNPSHDLAALRART